MLKGSSVETFVNFPRDNLKLNIEFIHTKLMVVFNVLQFRNGLKESGVKLTNFYDKSQNWAKHFTILCIASLSS